MKYAEQARWLARVLLPCVCLLFLLHTTDWREMSALLATVRLPWLLGAVVAAVLSYAACALRWSRVSSRLGLPLPFRSALKAYCSAALMNQLLPFGVAGDLFRVGQHAALFPERKLRAASTVLVERLSGQLVLWSWLLASVPFWYSQRREAALYALLLAVALPLGCALLLRSRRLWTHIGAPAVERWLAELSTSQLANKGWALHLGTSGAAVLSCGLMYYCATRALTDALSPIEVAQVAPLVLLASSLPSAVLGLGPREVTSAVAFGAVGHAASSGASVSLLFGAASLIGALPGLLCARANSMSNAR